MKVIIAGSRTITDASLVVSCIETSGFMIREVVCGGANGVDTLAKQWATMNGIPVKDFPAEWEVYGKSAGPIRNEKMAKYADALILVWDGKSKGSANMLLSAKKHGLRIKEFVT